MDATLRRFMVLTVLVLATAGLLFLSVMQPVVGTRTDFSVYNTRWNGASGLGTDLYEQGGLVPTFSLSLGREDVEVVHRSFAAFDVDPQASSLVLLGPDRGLTADEAAWLRGFVQDGGRVLLADDFGTGNQALEAMGATSRFDGRLVRDLSYSRSSEFVLTTNMAPHPFAQGVGTVMLDYPTALTTRGTVLGTTFASAWADGDDDKERDAGEPTGPFPWLAHEAIGQGELLVVADPSLFINGVRPLADNEVLVGHVVSWLTADGRAVLIDESHRDYADPVRVAGVRLEQVPSAARVGLAAIGLVAFLALTQDLPWAEWGRMARLPDRVVQRFWPEPEPARPDLVARALERHPDWDETVLRELLVERDSS